MFVFDCYTSQSTVENALSFPWPDYRKTSIESSDSVCLVVFVQGSDVVYWFEQPRRIELGGLANGSGYSRSEAKFQISRDAAGAQLHPVATGNPGIAN
jgi:hypothetical protein